MTNTLEHLAEFQAVLKDYRISPSGKKTLAETKLALLVGPSSSGRNTIIKALLKTGEYHYIVSDTTRVPRVNDGILEQDGVEYWFRTEEEALDDLKAGKFLEAALIHNQQVSGISLRELEKAHAMHKVAVNEIEIVGMQNIINAKPDVYAFFVAPPSFEVWMQRMDSRGNMTAAEKHRRLLSAIKEYKTALESDYYIFLINDEFEHSVKKIHKIVIEGINDSAHQIQGREIVEKLYRQTQEFVA